MSLIEAKNIYHSYNDNNKKTEVLSNVSIKLNKLDTISIMGESGSGKSTLLHLLGGLDKPISGEILYKNNSIFKKNFNRSNYRNNNVGFIFQSYHLLSELNILENVALPALRNKNKDQSISDALFLLNEVGLSNRIKHRPQELSGGEKQRVAIARALINNPEIILADEPTGNLDEENGNNILNYLFKLVELRGHSIILVTHSKNVAMYCKSKFIIENGNLINKS
ncbi:MAG: ABC transporter ATP-binding protein [Pontiellaceae bacterium]